MKYILIGSLGLMLLFINSCSKPAGCVDDKAINYDPTITVANSSCIYPSIQIQVDLKMGSLPFEINRIYNIGGHNTAFKVFQCYLSDIQLIREDQSYMNYDSLFPLLKEGNTTIPLGEGYVETFERLTFNVGVPPAENFQIGNYLNDPNHPLKIQLPDTMHWSLTDGYIFLKMVGKVDRNGDGIPNENEAFNMQIGTNDLLRSIDLTINKSIEKELETILLELDVEKLLLNVDLQTEQATRTTHNLPLATKIADNIIGAIRFVE